MDKLTKEQQGHIDSIITYHQKLVQAEKSAKRFRALRDNAIVRVRRKSWFPVKKLAELTGLSVRIISYAALTKEERSDYARTGRLGRPYGQASHRFKAIR